MTATVAAHMVSPHCKSKNASKYVESSWFKQYFMCSTCSI